VIERNSATVKKTRIANSGNETKRETALVE